MAPMNEARSETLVVAHAGKLWAFGGWNRKFEDFSSVKVYDSETNSWSYVSKMPTRTVRVVGGILCENFSFIDILK